MQVDGHITNDIGAVHLIENDEFYKLGVYVMSVRLWVSLFSFNLRLII